jgi:hypothetical protein
MDRDSKNNRSLLAMAGENSLLSNSSKHSFRPLPTYKSIKDRERQISPSAMKIDLPASNRFNPK